jgi:hypothetical protein
MAFTIISGITLVILSININFSRKITIPKIRKEKPVPVLVEYVPPPLPQVPQPIIKVSEVKPRKKAVKKNNGPVS